MVFLSFSFLEHRDVISVHENKGLKLHTTRSWNFLGVENDGGVPSNSLWNLSSFGESTIIGNIDTGRTCFPLISSCTFGSFCTNLSTSSYGNWDQYRCLARIKKLP